MYDMMWVYMAKDDKTPLECLYSTIQIFQDNFHFPKSFCF